MDAVPLAKAYSSLLTAVLALPREDPLVGDQLSLADWVLAHVALTDAALTRTGRQLLAEEPAGFDNRRQISADSIGSVIAAHDWQQLVELVRATAASLVEVVEQIPAVSADRPVQVRMVNRSGVEVFDDRICWRDLVGLRAREQIPAHTEQLHRLLRLLHPVD